MRFFRALTAAAWRHATWLIALAALGGCATLPADPVEQALYTDLRKAVELSEDIGWVVERVQLESNVEDAMRSVCRSPRDRRNALDSWLAGQIIGEGGPAATRFRDQGEELSELSRTMTLERTRALLNYADARAEADCPFWLEPEDDFRGVHADSERTILLLESIGFGNVVIEGDETALGGGGGGRLLLGYGLSPKLTLAMGAEVGGTGAFQENDSGSRRIDTTFTAAMPMLLRLSSFSRIFDVEFAPAIQISPGRALFPPGARVSVAGGLATMRSSTFMPYVVLWAGYEVHPGRDGLPTSHSIRIGTRVGIDWDP